MRAVDCPCGEYLEGRNDSELLEKARQHADADHENEYSEADLKILVDTRAYDVR